MNMIFKLFTKTGVGNLLLPMLLIIITVGGCKKFLDKKSEKTLVVPDSISDLQALLDNNGFINFGRTPCLISMDDDFYVTTEAWQNTLSSPSDADMCYNYIWEKDATSILCWKWPYQGPIYYSNIVLDILPKIQVTTSNQEDVKNLKGYALFYRAFNFYQLAQLYCRPYSSSANTDPGIPLKLSSDIDEKYSRLTVQHTYNQIINDFVEAAGLLPNSSPYLSRPTKAAAYGALARAYLSMRKYDSAGKYADLCLREKSDLMDFNTLSVIPELNAETVYFSYVTSATLPLSVYGGRVDSTLYNSYDNNDLRKTVFFEVNSDGSKSFKGSYTGNGSSSAFDGVTTDEMYLIRAECSARANNKDSAMADLNRVMQNRWNSAFWVPFTAANASNALSQILTERRKELLYRGLRWSDLRRFNLDDANITLKRVINNITYTLPPGDNRWVLLIPKEEINRSGIDQNIR